MPVKIVKLLLFCLIWSAFSLPTALAQESANVTLTLVEERRIGTDCPAASALSPDGSSLWVLMQGCFDNDYYMLNFSVGSSEFDFNPNDGEDYTSLLASLEGVYIDGLLNPPLSVAADGTPQLQVVSSDGVVQGIRPAEGASAVNSALTEQIINHAIYPEYTVFNADQSVAGVIGADAVHVFDVASAAEVMTITVEGGAIEYTQIQFSADGQSLDLIIPNNPENANATASTLYRYSVPDGELLMEHSLLTSLAWVSPNGQYILMWMEPDLLVVIEPATGGVSDLLKMDDEPRLVTSCTNEGGFDPTDLEIVWDGFLPPMGINWLPDSSGFVTVNTYGGEGAQSDNGVCLFDESRLRLYAVGHEG